MSSERSRQPWGGGGETFALLRGCQLHGRFGRARKLLLGEVEPGPAVAPQPIAPGGGKDLQQVAMVRPIRHGGLGYLFRNVLSEDTSAGWGDGRRAGDHAEADRQAVSPGGGWLRRRESSS